LQKNEGESGEGIDKCTTAKKKLTVREKQKTHQGKEKFLITCLGSRQKVRRKIKEKGRILREVESAVKDGREEVPGLEGGKKAFQFRGKGPGTREQ